MDRKDSTASQDGFIDLQQLDPSPIESPYDVGDEEKQLPLPPRPPMLNRSSTLGLSGGGGGGGYVYYCTTSLPHIFDKADKRTVTRLQKYSSYVFTIYATMHISNTSLIPLITRSVPAAEPYLLLTRPYYQSFPLEPLLITLPIATHILSGLALRIHRRNIAIARYGANQHSVSERFAQRISVWPPVSTLSASGYILAPLVIGHAFVNRIVPYIYEGGSSSVGLGFVAHGFAKHPVVAWTGYGALIITAAGHFVWGMANWRGWTVSGAGNEKKAKRRWWTINGIVVALAGIWMAGGLGVVGRGGLTEGWVGKGYDALYAKVPLVKL